MTRTLGETAQLIRSKNAGPFWLTIDVFLATDADYQAARHSPLTDRDHLAETYAINPDTIEIYTIDTLRAIKISFPRPVPQGSPEDTDQHAGQQYVPLLDIPLDPSNRRLPPGISRSATAGAHADQVVRRGPRDPRG